MGGAAAASPGPGRRQGATPRSNGIDSCRAARRALAPRPLTGRARRRRLRSARAPAPGGGAGRAAHAGPRRRSQSRASPGQDPGASAACHRPVRGKGDAVACPPRRGAEPAGRGPAADLPAGRQAAGARHLRRAFPRQVRRPSGCQLLGATRARPDLSVDDPAMSKLDVLAIGPHPDDVELGCGGTLALAARQGRRVGILHLTRGESGTRGTPEQRLAEAEQAAAALGAVELAFLDCGDGGLRCGEPEEDALIEVLRTWRPELVLGPPRHDRHPDHERGHRLVAAAAFYSGLGARGSRAMAAHRPAAVFSYMQHHSFEPSFVVDVTAAWEEKMAALAAYRSQLYQPGAPAAGNEAGTGGADAGGHEGTGGPGGGGQRGAGTAGEVGTTTAQAGTHGHGAPAVTDGRAGDADLRTKVSSREFRLAIEGRARYFGQLIGAELGEPFWSAQPLAVADLLALLPGGQR